jgi:hypothetical protein
MALAVIGLPKKIKNGSFGQLMREITTNNTQGCDNHPEQLSRRQIPAVSQTPENTDSLRVLIHKDTHSKDIGTTGVKVIKYSLHEGIVGT